MSEIKVTLPKMKETKNMVRYETTRDGLPLRNLYVAKSAFEGLPPDRIIVTVEAA